jgi:GxxExxY protein
MLIDTRFNHVTHRVIEGAIAVHRTLGPGLLESSYKTCLCYELAERKVRFAAERTIPVTYKDVRLEGGYRVDLIVEDAVVVELKSLDQIAPIHKAQALTYMKLADCPVGLIINFNVTKLTDGVTRLILPGSVPRR